MWDTLRKSASLDDAATVLRKLVGLAEKEWPGLQDKVEELLGPRPAPTECSTCTKLLAGLSSLAPFQAIKLSAENMRSRRYIDNLVKDVVGSREAAKKLGYNVGKQRWLQASEPEKYIHPGGKPSLINKEASIAAVRAALEENSHSHHPRCARKAMSGLLPTL